MERLLGEQLGLRVAGMGELVSPVRPGSSPSQHPSGSVTFSPMPGSTTHS
jgi:hypothetical protein